MKTQDLKGQFRKVLKMKKELLVVKPVKTV